MNPIVERVAKVVRKAREMSLCSLCDGPHRSFIHCSCNAIARAAVREIAAMEPSEFAKLKQEIEANG